LLRNPIEVYGSLLRAQQTQRWTKRKGVDTNREDHAVKILFSEQSFERFAKSYAFYLRRVLRFSDHPSWLLVSYDQLNNLSVQQEILNFLGSKASAQTFASQFEKQYEGPISEAFDNWDELADLLKREDPFAGLQWEDHPRGKRSTS
jgi:hypothetical protein